MALRCKRYYVRFHKSWLDGVWCSFQGWDVGTLGNTFSGCVTQDPRVGHSEACAIPLILMVRLHALVSPSVVHEGCYTNR